MRDRVSIRGESFTVVPASDTSLPGKMGGWDVTGDSGKTYRVVVFDPDGMTITCDCADFRLRKRSCKHIAAVVQSVQQ